ncbi:MAG TPA: 1-deoxy-D-xylulose-5-phosphate reductoisomerase [Fimbriimonadaceae bacterium]|nr:1-deoxy-D-xylulose-5-phosphate reductoisomerase [Fimbriimonadaceae bacterium]
MLRLAVLGSTGSIGRQTLDVVRDLPDRLQVVALAAGRNRATLDEQAREFGVANTVVFEEDGMDALVQIAADPDVDVVVVSVAGVVGLLPTLAAIEAGKHIALASKEVLVAAGEIVMPLAREKGALITPIDSEHSALFQCMLGSRPDQIDRLILTASGGPFRGRTAESLGAVTVDEALAHPTWRMGGKITVDSATLMNKGLEMIEARWLFDVPVDQIDVVVHPQSIAHSFVKFRDGSVLGQFGWPNMRLPIQYALLYPERIPNQLPPWNPLDTPGLTFEAPDEVTFRALGLARHAARVGGTLPCVLNAANEEAANAFLRREIGFLAIADLVEQAMEAHRPTAPTLDSLLAADAWARATTLESIRK